jgi:hypothetical protein
VHDKRDNGDGLWNFTPQVRVHDARGIHDADTAFSPPSPTMGGEVMGGEVPITVAFCGMDVCECQGMRTGLSLVSCYRNAVEREIKLA